MTDAPKTGTNVFEGKPDARQNPNVDHPVSRFRPTYRALTAGFDTARKWVLL